VVNPLRAWDRFWFAPTSARPLGAFRIAIGLIALTNVLLLLTNPDPWLTDAGLLRGHEARILAGPLRPSPLHWVQDPTSVRIFLMAVGAVAVPFILGWRTRLFAVLLYLGTLSIHNRNLMATCGMDVLLVLLLFYAALSPCGAAYSLDARRASRRRAGPAEALVSPWAQRLIQLQICVLYFCTVTMKLGGACWIDGSALHYILHNEEVRRFTFGIENDPLLTNVMTYSTLLIELALPFLLWFRASRPFMLMCGVLLHLGISVTINAPLFAEMMFAAYLCFLKPTELDALLRAVDVRRWSGRRSGGVSLPEAIRLDGPSTLKPPHRPTIVTTDATPATAAALSGDPGDAGPT
jgi:hypothetical protein